MADGSTIEWLNRPGTRPASWNPIRAVDTATGKRGWYCEHVHDGCRFCYAEAQNVAGFHGGTGLPYKPGHRDQVKIVLDEKTLLAPLRWREPRTIFTCSMSDLYGPWVPDAWLDRIKAVQALTPRHTYIDLTKRPERQRDYLAAAETPARIAAACFDIDAELSDGKPLRWFTDEDCFVQPERWPLANVWGLASCSTQEDADRFVPMVLDTPLAMRGVSAEPLLGPMILRDVHGSGPDEFMGGRLYIDACSGKALNTACEVYEGEQTERPRLDWVIVGGESGLRDNARACDLAWVRAVVNQCAAAGVACFVKQLGRHPVDEIRGHGPWIARRSGTTAESKRLLVLKHPRGGDPAEWPEELNVRQWPEAGIRDRESGVGIGKVGERGALFPS